MNRTRDQVFVPVLLVVASLAAVPGCESDQKPAPATTTTTATTTTATTTTSPTVVAAPTKPLTVEESAQVKVRARVKAIDFGTRMVTLEESNGRTMTMFAGNEVRRLNEVSVGDTVVVDYTVSLLAELRPPTAAETANPVASVEVAGRSPQGSAPAAGAARGIRMVTTVQAVDQASMLVTLRGPGGDTFTVRGRNPDNVARLRIGDTIVITYTETAVIALEKAST